MFQQYFDQVFTYQKKLNSYAVKNLQLGVEQTEKYSKSFLEALPMVNEEYKKNLLDSYNLSLDSTKQAIKIYEDSVAGVDTPEAFIGGMVKMIEDYSKLYFKGTAKVQAQVLESIEKTKEVYPKEFSRFFELWTDSLKNGSNVFEKSVNENIDLAKKTAENVAAKKATK